MLIVKHAIQSLSQPPCLSRTTAPIIPSSSSKQNNSYMSSCGWQRMMGFVVAQTQVGCSINCFWPVHMSNRDAGICSLAVN
ncbi:hypothetical protein XENTR_v10017533 [Xenopus tropicalis]|nr:hypothetical protein XENTR_v10017533 [Xenopus tropicalis]